MSGMDGDRLIGTIFVEKSLEDIDFSIYTIEEVIDYLNKRIISDKSTYKHGTNRSQGLEYLLNWLIISHKLSMIRENLAKLLE